jgi:hypothetical protein
MIYFILTSCIIDECPVREREYYTAYASLECAIHKYNIQDTKIIFVENNGKRKTYLDELGCDVFYTNNNSLPTKNKGRKELQDVLDCIEAYSIGDDDFVVKLTGRYIIDKQSQFMETLKTQPTADCIIKYASYASPFILYNERETCISGLVGMRSRYIKMIEPPTEEECAEWKWAAVTWKMDEQRVIGLPMLGLCMHVASQVMCFV